MGTQITNKSVTDLEQITEEILEDCYISSSGKKYVTDWKGLKQRGSYLVASYRRLGMDKQAGNVAHCGVELDFLELGKDKADGNQQEGRQRKLYRAFFCKNRLCPMCMKRRQMKIYSQVSKVMDTACAAGDCDFLFLTLTCPNCYGSDLQKVLDNLYKAFDRLMRRPRMKRAFIGWYRVLEINFDGCERISTEMYHGCAEKHIKGRRAYYDRLGLTVGSPNPNYKKFHPHFHVILMVEKDYFTGKNYLSQQEIAKMWADNLKVPGQHRQVFIEKIKPVSGLKKADLKKAVAEVAKYPIKDMDILLPADEGLTDYAVYYLHHALFGRRLISFGGKLREIHKALNLTDPIDGDLVHIDDEKIREDVQYIVSRYSWRVGATSGYNYYLDGRYLLDKQPRKRE